MIPSRRQRYFRPNSPSGTASPSGSGNNHQTMNSSNMNVMEQAELVMEGGDEQQVSHEEIVDDGTSEMVVEHHHPHQPMRVNPIHHHHYESRQPTNASVYQTQQTRRTVGRPILQRPSFAQAPIDMVQKLQNKSIYMPTQQRPQTRISPAGARIVSFAGRKRDNSDTLPPGVKKMNMSSSRQHTSSHAQSQQQHQPQVPKNLQPVKVVRLVSGAARTNPTASEHALIEIENNIKQTIEDSKVDLDRLRELQEAEISPEEYHQMLGMMIVDLERTNEANVSLTNFYRDRQRHEKTIYEARENAFAARIRQLETENRKLREATQAMYYAKFNEANAQDNLYRNEHMGQIMVDEPEEHVVIEEHVGSNQESEEVPQEWIVEETVEEHRMHLQGMESDEHHRLVNEQQQQEEERQDQQLSEAKDKNLLRNEERFGDGNAGDTNQ